MNDLIKRLRDQRWLGFPTHDVIQMVEEAADLITAMKADGDGLAGFVRHKAGCAAGIPVALASRAQITTECTCGLTDKLTKWKEASDGLD